MNNHINKELSGSKDKNKNDNFKLNSKQIEQSRKEKFDKQMSKSVKWILIGIAASIIANTVPYQLDMHNIISLDTRLLLENAMMLGAYGFGGIGLAKFTGILREPIDKEQAEEIEKEDQEEMERLGGGTRHR